MWCYCILYNKWRESNWNYFVATTFDKTIGWNQQNVKVKNSCVIVSKIFGLIWIRPYIGRQPMNFVTFQATWYEPKMVPSCNQAVFKDLDAVTPIISIKKCFSHLKRNWLMKNVVTIYESSPNILCNCQFPSVSKPS